MKLARELTGGDRIVVRERPFEVEIAYNVLVPEGTMISGRYMDGDHEKADLTVRQKDRFKEAIW